MDEWNVPSIEGREPADLEARLSTYYGPPLREAPLSSAAWEQLRSQLPPRGLRPRHDVRGRQRGLERLRRPSRRYSALPLAVDEAFVRVASEANLLHLRSRMRSVPVRGGIPRVRVSVAPWSERIGVALTLEMVLAIDRTGLEVLVASGLARYLCLRRPSARLLEAVLCFCVLLAGALPIVAWRQGAAAMQVAAWSLLFGLVFVGALFLAERRRRRIVYRTDQQVVSWLGRERVCRGLHVLADASHGPRQSAWGEPSLQARIERVCGSAARVEDERLTLVM